MQEFKAKGVVTYDKDTKRKQFTTSLLCSHTTRWGVVTYDKDTKRKQFTTYITRPSNALSVL